jgi:tetratricopeptide (TPR) repeat protein
VSQQEIITNLKAGFRWQARLGELERSFLSGTATISKIRMELNDVWANAVKVRTWSVVQARTDVRAAILCSKLAGCAGQLLDAERGRHVLIQWREDAVDAITPHVSKGQLPDQLRGDLVHDFLGHLSYLGYLHMANGNMERARQTLQRALEEGLTDGNRFAEGVVHLHLGMIAVREEHLDEAEADLQKVLSSDQAPSEPGLIAASRNLLGVVAERRGES